MKPPMFGALVGLILGFAWVLDGFWSMILVAIIAGIGALIGKYVKIDRKQISTQINRFLSDQ
ncbi:DUF2273 domain-containing protein [Furfurilactobacillus curtus]|uniref:DUF2273 domain-containing protein n=1 Tax=Furfurilactobacillus curtus TaxID=1746200 RepID=A0ABQ5JTL5_9LACO